MLQGFGLCGTSDVPARLGPAFRGLGLVPSSSQALSLQSPEPSPSQGLMLQNISLIKTQNCAALREQLALVYGAFYSTPKYDVFKIEKKGSEEIAMI